MPTQRPAKPPFVSHLADRIEPTQHRGAVLPEEAADAGGTKDRLSVVSGLVMMVALVAGLTLVFRWIFAP